MSGSFGSKSSQKEERYRERRIEPFPASGRVLRFVQGDSTGVSKYKSALICVFLAGAALAVYWRVLYCDFVNFDDPMYVTENQFVNTGLYWENITWAFSVGKVAYWHPLTWLSHILDCAL
jgi:hypothetical protein